MEGIKLPTEIQKALDAEKKKQGYTGIIFITMFVGIGIFFTILFIARYRIKKLRVYPDHWDSNANL